MAISFLSFFLWQKKLMLKTIGKFGWLFSEHQKEENFDVYKSFFFLLPSLSLHLNFPGISPRDRLYNCLNAALHTIFILHTYRNALRKMTEWGWEIHIILVLKIHQHIQYIISLLPLWLWRNFYENKRKEKNINNYIKGLKIVSNGKIFKWAWKQRMLMSQRQSPLYFRHSNADVWICKKKAAKKKL